MTFPIVDFNNPNDILNGRWPWRIPVVWCDSENCWMPMNGDALNAMGSMGPGLTAIGTNTAAANTNLQDIKTLIAATNAALDIIKGYTDGIEGLAANTNTLLGTGNTSLGSILTAIGTTNSTLATTIHNDLSVTLAGYLDGLEALITSTNTKLDTLTTAVNTLTMAEQTAIASSTYTATLGVGSNTLVKTGSTKVWGYSVTGVVVLQDNAAAKWTTVGNTSVTFNVPLICTTSLRLVTTLGAGINLQYT